MGCGGKGRRVCRRWRGWGLSFFLFAALAGTDVSGQTALQNCAAQFIGGDPSNAPTVLGSAPGQPFKSNRHLCYRDDSSSFFAIEYWPEEFAPRWAAYKLSQENYGSDGCKTYTRDGANCYFAKKSWAEVESCTKASDPVHGDRILDAPKLAADDFSNTGHDLGHIAPRQAFSWHVCGTYQTFTMANMSPQRAFLNQRIWRYLERQVLTWAVDAGPLYVVSGTVYRSFPHGRFEAYSNGTFDAKQIYAPGATMLEAVTRHASNFAAHSPGHRLRPVRNARPESVPPRTREMRMPTGYYKVVYRPQKGQEPAHAIGFLVPHSYENLNNIPNIPSDETFWAFVSRIDVIEAASGVRVPGIPEAMKSQWGDPFFLLKRTGRDIRSPNCGKGSPKGVVPDSTRKERLVACTDRLR